jgi:hypothetical protein
MCLCPSLCFMAEDAKVAETCLYTQKSAKST